MLKIITAPNPILTTPAKPVVNFDKKLEKIIEQMEETLVNQTDPQGVGLAAPQVNIPLAIFIMKPKIKGETKVFINPKIIDLTYAKQVVRIGKEEKKDCEGKEEKTQKKALKLEGCLSIPKIWGPVKRAKKVLLEYQTIKGEKKRGWFSGFEAVIIQHEIDHLNGILFTQRALEQNCQLYEEKEGKLEKIKSI